LYLILREERRLRVFVEVILRRIIDLWRAEVAGE
jgi:hypothetical protein